MKDYSKYWPWAMAAAFAVIIGINALAPPERKSTELALKADNELMTVLPSPKTLDSALALFDQDAQPFTLEQLKGQWSFLFFGYTHCPDVCPVSLGVLKRVYEQASEDHKPQVVLVSVDPKRDNTERLKEFVGRYHASFIGTRADRDELTRFTKEMGVHVKKGETIQTAQQDHSQHQASDSHEDHHAQNNHDNHEQHQPAYLVDHTNAFFLINPKAELVAVLSPPHHDIAGIAHEYNELVQR